MQNIVIDMCEKFHNDQLRNDRALVYWKSNNSPKNNNNKNKNNVGSAWHPKRYTECCLATSCLFAS